MTLPISLISLPTLPPTDSGTVASASGMPTSVTPPPRRTILIASVTGSATPTVTKT